jgi:hypothetical protein
MHESNMINAFAIYGLIEFFVVQLPVRAQLGLIDNVPVKVTDLWVLW